MSGDNRAHWHQQSVSQTYERLATRPDGLNVAEVAQRRARYGPNVLDEAPGRSKLAMLAAQFADFMVLILIAAAIVSGVIGDLTDTAIIIAIVVLNATLGFFQEAQAERALAALKAMAAPSATVMREGTQHTIQAADLVPGDVVILDAGRIVPADLRLVEVAGLRVNESALTGESVPVDKTTGEIDRPELAIADRNNIAHKGSVVTYGRALGIVIATGMRTEFGRIATLLTHARTAQTPLQRRLDAFGRRLAFVILCICAIVFATGLLRDEPALPMLLVALSLAVAAIPEALPAVVSIALALGARKMMAQQALIRRLPVVETLGSVTFICSDKTGTLTANQMRAEEYFCDASRTRTLEDTGAGAMLLLAMGISHDAKRDATGALTGDPTETALMLAAEAGGIDCASATTRLPRVAELPFDSERKCMTTVHQQPDGSFLSITKGAAEVVVAACIRELRAFGVVQVDRPHLAEIADRMATEGLRVLGFCVRQWQRLPNDMRPEVVERELTFVGLVGLIDPERPEAREAIAACKSAGIAPVMITGDHPLTARAIARRLGLISPEGGVLTGVELKQLSAEEFARRVGDVRVYARVAPEQKVKIVEALQAAGEIVAMTGDGVNDAPALKSANVGVAMGIQGTDVARQSAAIVLLDDNFATIVKAVREGRRIYDNLRRFVRYVLTTNSAEIWAIFLAPFVGLPVPLVPIQILWINLVSDGLPGLALAAERAERDIMQRAPRPPEESLFAHGLGAHAFFVGLLMAALVLAAQAWYWRLDEHSWQTVAMT
ncbi:MAG: cation-translocating P-type ATPase, partial [Steroidobacteraceae bacterium]